MIRRIVLMGTLLVSGCTQEGEQMRACGEMCTGFGVKDFHIEVVSDYFKPVCVCNPPPPPCTKPSEPA